MLQREQLLLKSLVSSVIGISCSPDVSIDISLLMGMFTPLKLGLVAMGRSGSHGNNIKHNGNYSVIVEQNQKNFEAISSRLLEFCECMFKNEEIDEL